mmetsp:Transcript_86151/g.191897  ORF Transcript_86151/g.191897 Transcript_86151/m.191897 type:complete len:310 (-) Transcript_86151:70-999(-)
MKSRIGCRCCCKSFLYCQLVSTLLNWAMMIVSGIIVAWQYGRGWKYLLLIHTDLTTFSLHEMAGVSPDDISTLPAPSAVEVCSRIVDVISAKGFWVGDSWAKELMERERGIEKVLDLIKTHRNNPDVQWTCLEAIRASVAGSPKNTAHTNSVVSVDTFIEIMKLYPTNPRVLGAAAAISGGLMDYSEQNSARAGELGANEVYMSALRLHSSNSDLKADIYCGFSGLLRHGQLNNTQRQIELGLIDVAISDLDRFPGQTAVREKAMAVLDSFAGDEGAQAAAFQAFRMQNVDDAHAQKLKAMGLLANCLS